MARTSSALLLVDLMRLVESEEANVELVIKAVFDWEHARILELARWLLATGAASVIAVFALLARAEPPSVWLQIGLPLMGGVLATAGFLVLRRAGSVHSRLAQTAILCARLTEVRQFLTRLRREGEL